MSRAFAVCLQTRRISSLIGCCEDELVRVRGMIDQLDTHVTTKLSLASLLSAVSFVIGLGYYYNYRFSYLVLDKIYNVNLL